MLPKWAQKPIENILLDINGVLFDCGVKEPIEGSVEAIQKLTANGFNFCLVTNECTTAKHILANELNQMGYSQVTPNRIVSPAPVACRYMVEQKLRPHFHVWDGIMEDFEPIVKQNAAEEVKLAPNCIVIGDAMSKVSRDFLDNSLEVMLASPERPQIISLGAGRYYKSAGRLRMDTGAYVAAFEFCLNQKAQNFGKPEKAFFREALEMVASGHRPATCENTVMIGDDIQSDVGGAQRLGMRGFLVRTGKYKPSDESGECGVLADHVFDNLKQAVDAIVQFSGK